jgi:hypothetical protein
MTGKDMEKWYVGALGKPEMPHAIDVLKSRLGDIVSVWGETQTKRIPSGDPDQEPPPGGSVPDSPANLNPTRSALQREAATYPVSAAAGRLAPNDNYCGMRWLAAFLSEFSYPA